MHRLIPTFILEKYRAGETQGQFHAVSMFLDISGFSDMTDKLMQHGAHGAEVLGMIMRNVFDPLLMTIFEQGGAIIGLAGDGLMALDPCGNDEDQALLHALASAWNMQQQLQTHPQHQTDYGQFPISAKIGLALEIVEWGILSSRDGERATYYFRGPAVDKASAAEQHARAGEIVMTQALCDCFEGLVIHPRGDFCLLEDITCSLPAAQFTALPPIDIEVARHFLPNVLLEFGLQSEFRQAVNLFVHFPDLDDTALPNLVYTLFDLQKRYGGLFTRLDFGDKGCNTLIFWGAPVAHQNDIGRALNFITDLQTQLNISLQAGVTYHISRAGYMGGELHEDYTCYGWGINLASRFMMSAQPGQIWVDERVAQRAQRRFSFEYISEQRFKGFAQKQKVYLLQGYKPQLGAVFDGAMVGRQAEMSQLDEFIARLQTGQGVSTLIVWGEPGVGKSRLVYEWMRSSRFAQPFTWAVCQSDQRLLQSFNPFGYWLRQYFGITEMAFAKSDQQKLFDERLDALIADTPESSLAAELNRLRSILAALLGLRWPDSLYEQLDSQARYDNTLLALTHLIEAESLHGPLVLIIEDAHFLDEDTLAFLPRLLRALHAAPAPRPVALLLTARRQGAALRLDLSLTRHALELERLSPDDLRTLAANLLEGPIAHDLTMMLETRAEGNPFFTEQLLRYLNDQNLLEWSTQGWRVLTAWNPAMLPTDISAVIVARLDQLAHEVKAVIQTAAVLGREFEVLTLAHMLRDDKNLSSELDEAERAAIWSPMSEIRYLFKHALVRDAAYGMQMQARRRELHALAVEALERLYAENPLAQIENLAYHSEAAGLDEKACGYLEQAGDAARDTYQNARAEDFYVRALAATPDGDLEANFRLRVECQKVLIPQGKPEVQRENLEALERIAEQSQDTQKLIHARYLFASYLLNIGKVLESATAAQEALELARQAHIPQWIVLAGQTLAETYHRQSIYDDALKLSEESLRIAQQHQRPLIEQAALLNLLGLIVLENQSPQTALAYFEQSLALYQQAKSVRGSAMTLNNLGLVAVNQGNYVEAHEYYQKSLQLARELGHRRGEGLVLGNLAWLSGLLGNYQEAYQYAEYNLQIAVEVGSRLNETFGLINRSSILKHLGNIPGAIRSTENALQVARQINNRNAEAWALTYLGHGLLADSQFAHARDAYQSAADIRLMLNQPGLACEPWSGLLQVAQALGEHETIRHTINLITEHLDTGGDLNGCDDPLRVYLNCYLAFDLLQDPRAKIYLKTALNQLNQRAANITDLAARQKFLTQVPTHQEILANWASVSSSDSPVR